MLHNALQHVGHILAVIFLICVGITLLGVSGADRLPAEAAEDDEAMEPKEGAHGAYVEPDHVQDKREAFVDRRSSSFLEFQQARAESAGRVGA